MMHRDMSGKRDSLRVETLYPEGFCASIALDRSLDLTTNDFDLRHVIGQTTSEKGILE